MLDINQSAMLRYPVKEVLIILCLILLAVLMFILIKDRKAQPGERVGKRLLALVIAALLVPSVVFLGIYEEPDYHPPNNFDMEITMTNSSSEIEMDDIWIQIDDADTYIVSWENGISYYGLVPGNYYEITFTCNETPVFNGLDSVTLNLYYRSDRFVAYYADATGNLTTVVPNGEDPYIISLAFSHSSAWVEFEIWASEIVY